MISTDTRLSTYPFALETELDDAAKEQGYRIPAGSAAGWRFWGSATARGEIALAAAGPDGPFFLSLEHRGVARELGADPAGPPARNHLAAFAFAGRDALFAGVSRAYRLAASLPTLPLELFLDEVAGLGDTEAESLIRRRIGQDRFRAALLEYHEGRCQLTGIDDPPLLRASHIIPWAKCPTDAERLNVHNGLLLSALWDSAFDAGLVSFDDSGLPLFATVLGVAARAQLGSGRLSRLTEAHRERLAIHRTAQFLG